MNLSQGGIDFIKAEEAFRAQAYRDQGGRWTIGYGHLIRLPAEQHLLSATITMAQGEALLRTDAADAELAVSDTITVPLAQNQFDALVSLAFNIGQGAFKRSTVAAKINSRAPRPHIEQWWKAWNKVTAGGVKKTSKGLSARRDRELTLFFSAGGPHSHSATHGKSL